MKDFFIDTILNSDEKYSKIKVEDHDDSCSRNSSENSTIFGKRKHSKLKSNYKNRKARVPYTENQKSILESYFQRVQYLSGSDEEILSKTLNIDKSRLKIWFQNKRARKDNHSLNKNSDEFLLQKLNGIYRDCEGVPANGFVELGSTAQSEFLKALIQNSKSHMGF